MLVTAALFCAYVTCALAQTTVTGVVTDAKQETMSDSAITVSTTSGGQRQREAQTAVL